MQDMKPFKKHTYSISNSFWVLLGIVLLSIIPFDSNSGEANSSIFHSIQIESVSENNVSNPVNDDSSPFDTIPDLAFNQAIEFEEPSLEINGFALLSQNIAYTDAGFISYLWTSPDVVQMLRLSSNEFTLFFIPSFAIPAPLPFMPRNKSLG
jgi:hypothetical protein